MLQTTLIQVCVCVCKNKKKCRQQNSISLIPCLCEQLAIKVFCKHLKPPPGLSTRLPEPPLGTYRAMNPAKLHSRTT